MTGREKYPHAFSPLKISKNITLKNRIWFGPHVAALADVSGGVTEELIAYVREQCRTGVGYITMGESLVDLSRGDAFPGEVNITNPLTSPGIIRLVNEAHKENTYISVELSHFGLMAPGGKNGELPLAPSEMPFPVKVVDRADMDETIAKFVDCALKCKAYGFDMVCIHSAHNNLLHSFLSPDTNHRTDEYGGSVENRMRFPLEVIKAVREAVGPDFALEIRVSASDMSPNGIKIEDSVAFCKEVQKYVNIINVTNGRFGPEAIFTAPSYLAPHMIHKDLCKQIKDAVDIPVSLTSNVNTVEEAEFLVANGYADIAGMIRALIAGPTMVRDAFYGEEEKTTPCIHCMDGCRGPFEIASIRCCVNPVRGREHRYAKLGKTDNPMNIMVIGGGPGGMQAARTAAERGHTVTLYEKSDSLGGKLRDATVLPFKEELRKYMEWAVRETVASGAKIVFNTEVTKQLIDAEKPDYIVVATGSDYIVPPIKGIDGANVHMLRDVDSKAVEVGGKVVVCGGGLSGVECAIQLAREGKDVTVVDMIPMDNFCGDIFPIIKGSIFYYAEQAGVKYVPENKVVEFTDKGVAVEDKEGNVTLLEADDAVIAFGTKPVRTLYEELAQEDPFKVYAVGDAIRSKNVYQATTTGFDAVADL